MKESEEKMQTNEERKEKIRERYKGVDESQLSVIPAIPKADIFDKEKELRVAVYARVSTDDPNQTSSYELQKNHYTDLVNRHENWNLVDIYADEGISGTSLKHRDNFIRMIGDAVAGKIDLIVTKSVSRFARNLLDGVGIVRKLLALTPPVGVFFETEGINTLKKDSEMLLAFMATMAQEESHTKSEVMNGSIEMRFKRGIFLTPPLLGYDQDENGNLVINEEEAKTVRLIYFLFLFSYSTSFVADSLMKLGRRTKKGNLKWTSETVLAQLNNERHCGSVLARKTYTPNYLDHKSKKNRNDRNQYFYEFHHEPIVSRDDFIAVQHILQNVRPGNTNILPELRVVSEGILSGFVSVNPRWKGFHADDYRAASKSVACEILQDEPDGEEIRAGMPDLRGYEVARSQFFNLRDRMTVTFEKRKFTFSSPAVRNLKSEYVELLVHPEKELLIVKPSDKDSSLSFHCAKKMEEVWKPRAVNASAILPNIFDLFSWNRELSYRMQGSLIEMEGMKLLLFQIPEAERLIPDDLKTDEEGGTFSEVKSEHADYMGTKKKTLAFPASWETGFGSDYYIHGSSVEKELRVCRSLVPALSGMSAYRPDSDISIPDPESLKSRISVLMESMDAKETVYV